MKIGGQEFDEKCPDGCPGSNYGYQGDVCYRCPIFNCMKDKPGYIQLLPPDQYNPEWAKEFRKWFDNGFNKLPDLRINTVDGKEIRIL